MSLPRVERRRTRPFEPLRPRTGYRWKLAVPRRPPCAQPPNNLWQESVSALSAALRVSTVASPQAGASRGGRGTLWDLTPGDAHGSAFEATRLDRLHGRIPQAGPCSTFRRSLLNVPTRPPWSHPQAGTCSTLRRAHLGSDPRMNSGPLFHPSARSHHAVSVQLPRTMRKRLRPRRR